MKRLQHALGIAADGKFGPATEKAVREYQQKNGLTLDGMAGPETLAHLTLFEEITAKTVELSQVPASMVEQPATPAASAKARVGRGAARRSIWDTVKSFFG